MNRNALLQALLNYATHGGKNPTPILQALNAPSPHAPPYSQQTHAPALGDGEGGGAGDPSFPHTNTVLPQTWSGGSKVGMRAVSAAATQLGKPYVFGSGPDTSSFDCSDLVQWAYKQVGVNIPRDTYGQMKVLPPKPWSRLQVGDPIYRKNGGHVVIYAGGGRVLAAPHTGTVVQYEPLSSFPQSEYQPYQIVKPR